MFETLFNKYLQDLKNNNSDSPIISSYLSKMCDDYQKNNSKERIVIDYIAGMTDDYFIKEYDLVANI